MRQLAVTDAMPQNSWAPITTSRNSLPAVAPSASSRICAGGTPVGDFSAPSYDWMAKVKPRSRTKPAIQDVQIERTMPFGPGRGRVVGLLGHVGGGVVAGEGVLGHQQPEERPRRRRCPSPCCSRTW